MLEGKEKRDTSLSFMNHPSSNKQAGVSTTQDSKMKEPTSMPDVKYIGIII
jgi:hypothetical protein